MLNIPNAIFGLSTVLVSISTEENFKDLKREILNRNQGYMILEEPGMVFPNRYIVVYNHKFKTATFALVEEEFVI